MSPFPVRCDSNAIHLPSGEYIGCALVAESAISRCAAPPCAATVQIAPPEANAIVSPSGDSAGCVIACSIGACAHALPAANKRQKASCFIRRWYHPHLAEAASFAQWAKAARKGRESRPAPANEYTRRDDPRR